MYVHIDAYLFIYLELYLKRVYIIYRSPGTFQNGPQKKLKKEKEKLIKIEKES